MCLCVAGGGGGGKGGGGGWGVGGYAAVQTTVAYEETQSN